MTSPEVSVLLSVYNGEDYVEESIRSILNQTFKNFELLIIDDASTDNSVAIIESINDSRITLIKNVANKRQPFNFNKGIELAKAEYIALMDADDIVDSTKLEKQIKFMDQNQEIIVCGTWLKYLGTSQVVEYPETDEEIRIELLYRSAVAHATTMFRRSYFMKHNIRYEEEFAYAEDYRLWTTLAGYAKIASIPEVLYDYRAHPKQISRTYAEIQRKNSNRCRAELLKKLFDNISVEDSAMAEMVFDMSQITEQKSVSALLCWLERLKKINSQKSFFNRKFDAFIDERKQITVNVFYKNREYFHPALFVDFLKTFKESIRVLSISDVIRLFLKCSTFYRTTTKNKRRSRTKFHSTSKQLS